MIWTESALADLRELVCYIARDDQGVAERFGNLIVSKVDALTTFPRLGRMVPEFGSDELRQVVVTPYRIVYEVDDLSSTLTIFRVWHGARGNLDRNSLRPGF